MSLCQMPITQSTQSPPNFQSTAIDQAAGQPRSNQLPSADFTPHFVIGDGDCLFRATFMGLNDQPGVQSSREEIMTLRQDLAEFVAENREALSENDFFGGPMGVEDLHGLLLTQGLWDEDAGDLVPPLLAQFLGREVVVLSPEQDRDSYTVKQSFSPDSPELPAGNAHTGEPPIFLAHTERGHYEYLEPRQAPSESSAISNPHAEGSSGMPVSRHSLDKGSSDAMIELDLTTGEGNNHAGKKGRFEDNGTKGRIRNINEQFDAMQNTALLAKQRREQNDLNVENTLKNNEIQNAAVRDAQIGYTANSTYDTSAKVLADQQTKAKAVAEAFKN